MIFISSPRVCVSLSLSLTLSFFFSLTHQPTHMSEDLPSSWVTPHVASAFPLRHEIRTSRGEHVTLERIVYETEGASRDAVPLSSRALSQLLALIDANLGPMYRQHGRAIYPAIPKPKPPHHTLAPTSWHPHKTREMQTPGLVYVTYHDTRDPDRTPLAFVSLLLTHEPELARRAKVLYLYEIHVAHVMQGLGLGTWLLCGGVDATLRALRRAMRPGDFHGLELTVFSGNERALKLYRERLQMSLAPWSPQDCNEAKHPRPKITASQHLTRRRTRARTYTFITEDETEAIDGTAAAPRIRPVYYVLTWPGCP
ncbi:LANO_0D05138g1_1 [Lachancea nothofagi CBS 11611]|uniref:N-alpha-acetyltransferase 40 n=1 Tax=Lachancea nothofagi CBS 11611 TaxID=1266666 RepID=A0A1G4JGW3_9SACH|nr:LANO_0D05138g1_1 [Lachancea nothofagi CBS 11611]